MMTIQVYFADGVPSILEGVTMTELYVMFCLVKKGKARISCDFRCGRRTISLDVGVLNPALTFGHLYSGEEYK